MSCKLVRSCVLLLLVIFLLPQSSLFGQNNNDDTLLVNREKVKWEALKSRTFAAHNEWFSKEMASIGYLPDASVYRTGFGDNFVFPKMDDLPPSTFILSGFKIVNASNEVKIVSYKADGPLFLYVTSIWAKRDNEWKTVFYQATKYKQQRWYTTNMWFCASGARLCYFSYVQVSGGSFDLTNNTKQLNEQRT